MGPRRRRRSERSRAAVGAVALVVGLAIGLGACGDEGESQRSPRLTSGSVVEYRFVDASVEPQYHRSYTLIIGAREVQVVVDSYGDVLTDTTVPLPAAVWDDLAANVGDIDGLDPQGIGDGCAGGTTRTLTVTTAAETVVDLDFGVCGDANTDAAELVDAFVQPVIDAIPEWDQLMRR